MSSSSERPKCLPNCDERHEEDCPARGWEEAYWFSYFGLRKGNTPEVRAHNLRQLEAFAPVHSEVRDE